MGEFQQEKGRNCEEKINEILTKLGWELSEYNRDIAEIENLAKGGPISLADYYILNNGTKEEYIERLEEIIKEM